jgi:excisionase family DNA binding protein
VDTVAATRCGIGSFGATWSSRRASRRDGPGRRAPGEFPLWDLVEEYCVALEVGGRSRRTIDWYRGYPDEFVAFAARDGRSPTRDDLTAAASRRWPLDIRAARSTPPAPNSIAGRVRTLRSFGGWVQLQSRDSAVRRHRPDPLDTAMNEPYTSPALRLAEVARRLSISRSSAHRLVSSGQLRGIRVGQTWRVLRADFEAYIEQRRADAERRYRDARELS